MTVLCLHVSCFELLGLSLKEKSAWGLTVCPGMRIEMEVILHGMEVRRKELIDKKEGAGRRKTER